MTNGDGEITGNDYARKIKKGDYFFLPHGAKEKFAIRCENELQIIECRPCD